MPRIEMAAQHDHFIRLVRPRDFRHGIVACLALRVGVIEDVELQLDVFAIRQQALDASEVVIAHDHRRYALGHIVGGVRLRHDNPLPRAASFTRTTAPASSSIWSICLPISRASMRLGSCSPRPAARAAKAAASAIGIVGVVLRLHAIVRRPLLGLIEIDRNHSGLAHQDDLALTLALLPSATVRTLPW